MHSVQVSTNGNRRCLDRSLQTLQHGRYQAPSQDNTVKAFPLQHTGPAEKVHQRSRSAQTNTGGSGPANKLQSEGPTGSVGD